MEISVEIRGLLLCGLVQNWVSAMYSSHAVHTTISKGTGVAGGGGGVYSFVVSE